MKITFLGTGTSQGVPPIGCQDKTCTSKDPKDYRLRSSLLINTHGKNFLIDCGPDFRQQMLSVQSPKIDVILLTHEHYDHIGGLEDIRPLNHIYKKAIPVYGLRRVLDQIQQRYFYAFVENAYGGSFKADLREVKNGSSIKIEDVTIEPIKIKHGSLDILGYKFGRVAYITDGSEIPLKEMKNLKFLDVLIINALREEEHPSHFNQKKALEIIADLQPKKAYLTHISHKLGKHQDVSSSLPSNVNLAFDGLSFFISQS